MAKIEPMDLVKSLSGKLCGHSDISFAKKGDTQYTMKRCNKHFDTPSLFIHILFENYTFFSKCLVIPEKNRTFAALNQNLRRYYRSDHEADT